ncbi:MAG: type II secretion system protein E [Chloroflexi bacterium RBG_16_68_14]|nr:MAG: type II secretion system protein E [Chloroflexi bacterium RBG_16_68_14]
MSQFSWQFRSSADAQTPDRPSLRRGQSAQAIDELKFTLHQRLIEELDPTKLRGLEPERAREAVVVAARSLIAQEMPGIVGAIRDELVSAVTDEVLGLGPIEPLIGDPSISEIMVNAPDQVFYEREGRLYLSSIRFRDHAHIMRIVERIVAPLGRRVDESSPMVDARLPDGSRVNVIIPPVAPKSPTITIRKFQADKMTIEDLIMVGSMTRELAEFFRACVQVRLNIIVSGGTGTGKTTLLNALSSFIPDTERIVTIEDPTELMLQQGHVVSLEARPPSLEGKGEVTQRDLVRNALRMRPDRIIVGEVRGPEAFDMMQAMNTGHEGSLGTVHANSPRDALARIENMILMAGLDLPVRAIREQMTSAIHVIVQIARLPDGSRKITRVSEITGMEGDIVSMQDLFRFEQRGIDSDGRVVGEFRGTGIRPRFTEKFEVAGIHLPPDLFMPVGV